MKIVQDSNWKTNNILNKLISINYFKIFKTDLNSSCDYYESGRIEICKNPKCSVEQCDIRDVPKDILDIEKRYCSYTHAVDRSVSKLEHWNHEEWLTTDENSLVYIDYSKNPPGWTGYTGNSANNIWLEVHSLCIEQDQCQEDDILRRLISGMHSNTNMHIAAQYPLEYDLWTGEVKKFGFNKDLFLQFFPYEEWVENMYFTYIFLLKSIRKLEGYLDDPEKCKICPQDEETRNLLYELINDELLKSCAENLFDSSYFFKTDKEIILPKLKKKFQTIARIINCTECEKCRIHAKQELNGIGAALKINFELEDYADHLSRNDIVALINTAKKFSDSVNNYSMIYENLKYDFKSTVEMFNGEMRGKRVLVIGAGLAGLSTAYELSKSGAYKVLLVDKSNGVGGNSAKATSGINGAGTSTQRAEGVEDGADAFEADTMRTNGFEANRPLVARMVARSGEAVEWLKGLGVQLEKVSRLGGHSARRTHRLAEGAVGWTIVSKVFEALKDRVKVLKTTRVSQLAHGSGGFAATLSSPYFEGVVESDLVVLATGGFSASREKLLKYAPQFVDYPTTNGAFATGDGLDLGESLGAQLHQPEWVQVHPTGFVDPFDPANAVKFLAPEALRGVGGLMLDGRGARFCDELGTRDYVSGRIAEVGGSAWLVLNEAAVASFGPNFNFYWKVRKFFTKYENAEEMASALGFEGEAVHSSFSHYNASFVSRTPDEFGRAVFDLEFDLTQPLYAAKITPVVHYTMGGLRIDQEGKVLNKEGSAIPGLYAVGEVTGGVHGKNRLAGNSLLECAVYGKIVAESIESSNIL